MNFLSLACFPKPVLVCTFWLCTSLDVEAGLCNPLSKKITFPCITLHATFAIQSVGHTSTAHTGEGTDGELEMEQGKRHSGTSEHNSWTGRYL
jgi:hypothetical protein